MKKLLGQLIITDISGPKAEKEQEKLIQKHNIGGIMLFNELNLDKIPKIENQIKTEKQTKKLIQNLKQYQKIFIAIDLEGGKVDRLHHLRNKRYKSPKLSYTSY